MRFKIDQQREELKKRIDEIALKMIDETKKYQEKYLLDLKERFSSFDETQSVKDKLYETVQETCNGIQDAAGKKRFTVKGDHAAYLEEEEEEEEDFFSSALVVHGSEVQKETAQDRLNKRDGASASSWGFSSWFTPVAAATSSKESASKNSWW
jgi:hypothetical protein